MADGLSECTITSRGGPDRATLVVHGDLVATSVDVLDGALTACLRAHPHEVAVDLAGVSFMDAAGISALLDCRGRATAQRVRLAVVHPNATVTRLMRPEVRALLAIAPEAPPDRDAAERRVLPCLACGATTEHVPGPTTRGPDGEVLVQWWSCTACDEGNTVVD